MDCDRTQLHDQYQRLMAKAAAGGLLPSGGLTPREQRDQLLQHFDSPATARGDLSQLIELLEKVVYARQRYKDDVRDGLQICDRLRPLLPDAPEVVPPSGQAQSRWSQLLVGMNLARYLIVAGLVLTFVFAFGQFDFSQPSSGATVVAGSLRGGDDRRAFVGYAGERDAVDGFRGAWSASSHNGNWVKMSAPSSIESRGPAQFATQLDLETGQDGYFPWATDPLHPPMGWSHRHFVYSEVDATYRMISPALPVRSAIGMLAPGFNVHDVAVNVNFKPNELVPIPSTSANFVVLDYSVDPSADVEFLRDGQDALYARAAYSGLSRLRYRVGTSDDYSFAALQTLPFRADGIQLPSNIYADAQIVITAIGDLPQPTFAATVRRLHAYFATFSVAKIKPHELRENAFLTVALARKGVCRHRARSFFIVANAVGVRTRLVENQIHSFCEVQQPNGTWRRIEFRLGDEPGPSATLVRTTNAVSEAPLAYALTPLLGCGVLALLLFGWRRDVFSHAVQSQERQSRNLQRSTQGLMEANGAVRVLLKHVCDRLVHRDLLALTSSAVTEADSSAPPRIRARIRSVLALCKRSQNDVFDIGEMQRAYWDSYYVLRWINREEKRDNHH